MCFVKWKKGVKHIFITESKVLYNMDTNSDIQPMSLISFSFVSLNAVIFKYAEFNHAEISPEMSTICKFVEYWV